MSAVEWVTPTVNVQAGAGKKGGRRRLSRRLLATGMTYAGLVVLGVCFVAPFLLMVSTSLKADDHLFSAQVEWIPHPIAWHNYAAALAAFPFLRYLWNTSLISALTVTGTVLSSSVPAYGFARLRWRGRDLMFVVMLSTLMLPEQVTMLPVFLIFRALRWTGTYLPLVVPPFLGSAFSIFLLRQFFLTIPGELSDAARLDGCSEAGIFARIVLPLSKPAMATVALFAFIGSWTDFTRPLIYLTDERSFTLAIGLQAFVGRHSAEWNLLMAAATVITLPLIVIFFLAQRTFIEGVALTGMKG